MKSYSNEAVSQDAALDIAAKQASIVQASLDAVDAKQTEQIGQLRLWLAASFLANVALTLALRFL